MFRGGKYVAGLWLGAVIAAYGVACAMLYFLTGEILVPEKRGARLLSLGEIAGGLETLADKVRMEQDE
ncbi:MAG: hypothetical protein JXA74_16860 [Anaerolineae bacterium]|nr:hypothetical protein [Anaerolineae bacterium]